MKLNTSFGKFKRLHKNKKNQIIFYSQSCKDYSFVENLYKFILMKKNSFIFESVEKGVVRGRYTIIGFNPDRIYDIKKNRIIVDDFKKKKLIKRDILKFLNELLENFKVESSSNLPRMSSMLVGYFSYDIIRLIEKIPDKCKNDIDIPDIRLIRPKNLIIYDNLKKTIFFIQNIFQEENIVDYNIKYNSIKKNFKEFQYFGNINLPENFHISKRKIKVRSNISKSKFKKNVLKAKEYIKKGDIFQVVLSQRFESPIDKPPIEIYNTLRVLNPSPFMFYFNFDDFQILGSSPEILVRLVNGEVTVRPIAGTRPRGINKKKDRKLTKELLKDPKELAEHLMLLDLGRNDVGKVSKVNTVKVTERFKVEKYSHVMHIVSNVVGKLKKNFSLFETFLSGFPAGTVSGAPKIRAMEIIDELESSKRKLYAGGIGYFTANQDFDTCIALRTALIKNKKIYVQAGAGIVADSNPKNEYNETVNKAKALLKAIN
ncbi:MAG: anthranilate synthase component I [Candidatus Marinimicrobia bacterium]|nr:anthranilate synthase component I [Candidatus Neomarinimicrobiota bacterium]RPG05890.1 MAG: anthranilate synthase component I [Pelagibacteraceae bacterium TMED247]|tara:strand:- start:2461 stop:3918 length:1458 start_codon:yes stop_codon:yes gene_type:complete